MEYYTLWVTNFHPFHSISYRFRDIGHFLFERQNRKWQNFFVKLVYTSYTLSNGSQIIARFALSLTVSEISATSCLSFETGSGEKFP